MSEIPERKILKEILKKLKTKTLTSMERQEKFSNSMLKSFENVFNKVFEIKGKVDLKALVALITTMDDVVRMAVRETEGTLEDMRLYIEALEHYCAELDKTLWDAIEEAKKEAEEQIKKQEEIMKRKSPESYIK